MGGLLAGVVEDHVDLAVGEEDHFIPDGVDIDGIPFAIWAFFRGAVIDAASTVSELCFRIPCFSFLLILPNSDVRSGAGETDEVTVVLFLDLILEASLPDVLEGAVFSDAVEEEAGAALVA